MIQRMPRNFCTCIAVLALTLISTYVWPEVPTPDDIILDQRWGVFGRNDGDPPVQREFLIQGSPEWDDSVKSLYYQDLIFGSPELPTFNWDTYNLWVLFSGRWLTGYNVWDYEVLNVERSCSKAVLTVRVSAYVNIPASSPIIAIRLPKGVTQVEVLTTSLWAPPFEVPTSVSASQQVTSWGAIKGLFN